MEIEAAMTNKTPQFNEPNMRIVKSAGFGAQLRAARETMSLTEKDAAARLHLSPKIIQIMEEENFENGPPATFIRGYLRSYARMLCISEEMIHTAVARLESAIPQTPHPSAPPILKTQSSNQTHHYLRLMTYVVIAALLVLMSLWWTSHPKDILTAAKTTAIEQCKTQAS
jgi:cytoskeleton protein RodZ